MSRLVGKMYLDEFKDALEVTHAFSTATNLAS